MKIFSVIFILLSLTFMALGLWFGMTYDYAPTVGFVIGSIFYLLSVKFARAKNREKNKEKALFDLYHN